MNVSVDIIAQDLKDVLLVPNEAVKEPQEAFQLAAMFNNQNKSNENSTEALAKTRNNNFSKFKMPELGNPKQKFVLVLEKGKPKPTPVEIGVSNLDYTEIKSGLNEGEEVLTIAVSQMMQDREAMKERMKKWSSVPGMQKQK